MRYQHQDSMKTRELMWGVREETRQLVSGSEKDAEPYKAANVAFIDDSSACHAGSCRTGP